MALPSVDRKSAIIFIACFGLVSLFADMTYEGARSSIGPLLDNLGASVAAIAFISGFGEMVGAGLRFFSGRLADRTHAYWTLTIFGYAVNVLAVPALAFAHTWQAVAVLITLERTGKAVRGPARDLLLSEATGVVGHGWGFGLHTAMDQTGACLGPLIMAGLVARSGQVRPAFAWLAIPAAAALVSLVAARAARPVKVEPPPLKAPLRLPRLFRIYIAAAGLLACGFIDFPVLASHFARARLFSPVTIPILYSVAMGVNGVTAFLFGRLFDRHGLIVLVWGILISAAALPLGLFGGTIGAWIAIACWASGLGVQDATLRAGIARVVSMNKRGSAFGAFNGVYGVMWFLGSTIMGLLYGWSLVAVVVFGVGAQLIAAGLFFRLRVPLAATRQV